MVQMIKGIDIVVCNNGKCETVSNILVGEPASQDATDYSAGDGIVSYILAIPKGDKHKWVDSKVFVFGEQFRTVGFPLQGIEENIPLQWNKKVKIQKLVTNSDITIYENKTFDRHIFKDVHFSESKEVRSTKDGVKADNRISVHIYAPNISDFNFIPKVGDIIVKGICNFEFSKNDEKDLSNEFQIFKRQNPNFSVVNFIDKKVYGTLPDYIITAR